MTREKFLERVELYMKKFDETLMTSYAEMAKACAWAAKSARQEFSGKIEESSWLMEERFADFREAYGMAKTQSIPAQAFSRVTAEDAYRIWHSINQGFERAQRLREKEGG